MKTEPATTAANLPTLATMLSVVPQHPPATIPQEHCSYYYPPHPQQQYHQHHHPHHNYGPMPHRVVHAQEAAAVAAAYPSPRASPPVHSRAIPPHPEPAVAQALEIARESPDGAQDPTIVKILEHAINDIWGRVQADPDTYVMSRPEFAVFNFYQHRFMGNKIATAARRRYWDVTHA